MIPTWNHIKSLLRGLDGRQPPLDAAAYFLELKTLLAQTDMGSLLITGYGGEKLSLAHHLFTTGNIKILPLVDERIRCFPATEKSIGYDSFCFPFPADTWPKEDKDTALDTWKALFPTTYTQHLKTLAIQSLKNNDIITFAWTGRNGLWDLPDILPFIVNILDIKVDTQPLALYHQTLHQGLTTLHPDTDATDLRLQKTPMSYAVGCALYSAIQCPLKEEDFKGYTFASAHQLIQFQQALGPWTNWAGKGKAWGKHHLKTLLIHYAKPALDIHP